MSAVRVRHRPPDNPHLHKAKKKRPRAPAGASNMRRDRRDYRFTASFSPLPAEKRGRFAALIFTGAPVRGSRPSRAARLTTRKLPKPMIFTSPPFFRVEVMASKVASTAVAAAVFVI